MLIFCNNKFIFEENTLQNGSNTLKRSLHIRETFLLNIEKYFADENITSIINIYLFSYISRYMKC